MNRKKEMKKAKKILKSGTKEDVHKFLEVPKGKKPKVVRVK